MLINIDPLLSPDLLHILRAMGHGDEIAIVDANFPGTTNAQRLVRLDGISVTRATEAVLSVMPLDDFVDVPAVTMEVVGNPDEVPPAVQSFARSLEIGAVVEHWSAMHFMLAPKHVSPLSRPARHGFTAISS